MHFFFIIHKTTTPSLRPQTPPASRKRQRIDDEELVTIEHGAYEELITIASIAMYEGCYGKNDDEIRKWIEALVKKIKDAREGKPPPPPQPSSSHPPLTDEQLKRMDIDAIRRDLDYTIPGLFLEIRKLRGDGNQHNRFSSFDYTGKELDDYAGSQLKMIIENDDGEYFSCFKHLKAHVLPMVSGLNLQVAEMRDHIQMYDKSILGTYGKLSRLEKTIASIQDDVKQMREDITAIEQEGKGSFGFRDEDGYKRCRSEICWDTEMKMYTMHTCYLDCVKEMMRESRWWDEGGWFKSHMDTFLQLAIDGSISSDEWLNCYKAIVNNMERDKDACAKRKVAIPNKIHHLAKQLSLDALFTTNEEREAGHTMVSCDLTDCHYCHEKKKKTATLSS